MRINTPENRRFHRIKRWALAAVAAVNFGVLSPDAQRDTNVPGVRPVEASYQFPLPPVVGPIEILQSFPSITIMPDTNLRAQPEVADNVIRVARTGEQYVAVPEELGGVSEDSTGYLWFQVLPYPPDATQPVFYVRQDRVSQFGGDMLWVPYVPTSEQLSGMAKGAAALDFGIERIVQGAEAGVPVGIKWDEATGGYVVIAEYRDGAWQAVTEPYQIALNPDTSVIAVPGAEEMTQEEAERLTDRIIDKLPGLEVVHSSINGLVEETTVEQILNRNATLIDNSRGVLGTEVLLPGQAPGRSAFVIIGLDSRQLVNAAEGEASGTGIELQGRLADTIRYEMYLGNFSVVEYPEPPYGLKNFQANRYTFARRDSGLSFDEFISLAQSDPENPSFNIWIPDMSNGTVLGPSRDQSTLRWIQYNVVKDYLVFVLDRTLTWNPNYRNIGNSSGDASRMVITATGDGVVARLSMNDTNSSFYSDPDAPLQTIYILASELVQPALAFTTVDGDTRPSSSREIMNRRSERLFGTSVYNDMAAKPTLELAPADK